MRLRCAVAVSVLLAGTVSGCFGGGDSCVDVIVGQVDAPDHRRLAVTYVRNCGSTTGFSTQVSIVKAGDEPDDNGKIFVADGDHGAVTTLQDNSLDVRVEWPAADRVLISHPARARVFTNKSEHDGVRIDYRTF